MSAVPLTSATPASDRVTGSDAHATHSDYAVHPEAVRLRAVTLWCEGLRFPAISKQLGVPERTIRAWLADARADFHSDQGETAHERIALAVERQLAIAAAAWTSYHHAVELEQLALDYYRAGLNRTAALKNIEDELPPPPPRPSTAPARYLAVALAAQREAARLSGCYDVATVGAAVPLVAMPHVTPQSSAPISARTATAPSAPNSTTTASVTAADPPSHTHIPAVSATASSPIPARTAAVSPNLGVSARSTSFSTPAVLESAAGLHPAELPQPRFSAETATVDGDARPAAALAAVHASAPPHAWQHIM